MTEKRSDYQKKIKHKKGKNLFNTIKSAFEAEDDVDVNPDFTRSADETQADEQEQRTRHNTARADEKQKTTKEQNREDKASRLKKRLNHAILLVLLLIILVLVALFHL